MKEKQILHFQVILPVVLAVFCIILQVAKKLSPLSVLPTLTWPVMAGIVLASLAVETYVTGRVEKRNTVLSALIGAAAFLMIPFVTGMHLHKPLWQFAVGGLLISLVATALYDSVLERLFADGEKHLLAPVTSALMLFLASQALQGIL